ncbi:hypothetical protein STENM327S_05050 [Streptomyces tendae]
MGGQWGAKRITGRLGAGNGRLKATTVSGSIALLRRPTAEDTVWEREPEAPTRRAGRRAPRGTIPLPAPGPGRHRRPFRRHDQDKKVL